MYQCTIKTLVTFGFLILEYINLFHIDCPEDFTLGLLWERSLTKTTYKHKCSNIHPSFKFADSVTRDCLKNRTWAPVNITQCVMDSDTPVVMIVIINLATDNSSLVKLRKEIIIEEVNCCFVFNQLAIYSVYIFK